MQTLASTDLQPLLADWKDVAELFGCGKSKALLLMKQIGIVRIGKTPFVRTEDMEAFVRDNNAVKLNWPKKRRH